MATYPDLVVEHLGENAFRVRPLSDGDHDLILINSIIRNVPVKWATSEAYSAYSRLRMAATLDPYWRDDPSYDWRKQRRRQ